MALGIFDVAKVPAAKLSGNRRLRVVQFTTDTDYPTGGYPLAEAALGFSVIDLVIVGPSGGYVAQYDYVNEKLMILFGDNNNAADGPLIEVAAGADAITGLLFRGIVIGVDA